MAICEAIHLGVTMGCGPCQTFLDPLSVKLRPHEDKQSHVPNHAPRLHQTDGIAHGEVGASGNEGLARVEQDDAEHEQIACLKQPWPVPVGDGKVEDWEAEGYQDGPGDDQGLDGSQGEFVGKVTAVNAADVVAQVGRQRVGQLQRHCESEGPP